MNPANGTFYIPSFCILHSTFCISNEAMKDSFTFAEATGGVSFEPDEESYTFDEATAPGPVIGTLRSVVEAPIRFERGLGAKIGDVAAGAARTADIIREGDIFSGPPTATTTLMQRRRAYVQAMSDPRYQAGLTAAGDDPAKIARVESLLGPQPRLELMRTAESLRAQQAKADAIARQLRLEETSRLYQWGREQTEFSRKVFGGSPDIDETFVSQLAEAAGGTTPDILLSRAPIVGPALASTSYGLQAGEQQAQEALAAGKPEAADLAFVSAAGLGFTSERLIGVAPRFWQMAKASRLSGIGPEKFRQAWSKWAEVNPLKARVLEGATRETVQETSEQIGQNLIASDLAGYDPDRPFHQGAFRAGGLGGALGGIFGGLSYAARPQTAPVATPRPPDDELPPAPILQTPPPPNVAEAEVVPALEEVQSPESRVQTRPRTETPNQQFAREQREASAALRALKAAEAGKTTAQAVTPVAQPTAEAPEKIVKAVVRVENETFEGSYHGEATDKAVAAGKLERSGDWYVTKNGDRWAPEDAGLYLTNRGRLLSSEEARSEFGITNMQEINFPGTKAAPKPKAESPAAQVTERHLAEARDALAAERPADVLDDVENVTSRPVQFPQADFADTFNNALQATLSQAGRPTARTKRLQRRVSLTEGEAADRVLKALAEENPKYADWTADDLATAMLRATEAREGTGEDTGSASENWYSGKGRQVGIGSDGEPVVIPTGRWKKLKAADIATGGQATTELPTGKSMFQSAPSRPGEGATPAESASGVKPNVAQNEQFIPAHEELPPGGEAGVRPEVEQQVSPDPIEAALDKAIEATNLTRTNLLEGVSGAPVWMTKAALNGALRVIRATYRGTKSLAQAIQAGLEWLRAQNIPSYSETEAKAYLERSLSTRPEDDDLNFREFIDQMDQADAPMPDVARQVGNLLYTRRTNESDAAFAARIIAAAGGPQAAVDIFTDATNGLPGSVRMLLGQLIIRQLGAAGQHEAAARFYDESFAAHVTDVAQGLQSLNAWLSLTPEGKVIWAQRKIERSARDSIAPHTPELEAAHTATDQANATGIETATADPKVQSAAAQAVDQAVTKDPNVREAIHQEAHAGLANDPKVRAEAARLPGAEVTDILQVVLDHFRSGSTDIRTLTDKLTALGVPGNYAGAFAKSIEAAWLKKITDLYAGIPERLRNVRLSKEVLSLAERIVTGLETQAVAARARLKEKFASLGAGVDPTILVDLSIVGAAHLGRATLNFAQWSAKMLSEFGPKVNPYLPEAWQLSKQRLVDEAAKHQRGQPTKAGRPAKAPDSIDQVLRRAMREQRVKFSQVIRQHYTQADATGQSLAQKVAVASGLPAAEAEKLARTVEARFAALVTAQKTKALDRLLRPIVRSGLAKSNLTQKLVAASNLGALSTEQFWDVVRQNLNLPGWSPELASRVRAQVDAIERIPNDQLERKQKAQTELLNIIERAKGIDGLDLGIAFYMTNILTGITTHLKNLGSTFLNATATLGTEIAQSVARGQLSDIPIMLEALGKGFRHAVQSAGDVLQTGIVTGSRLEKVAPGRVLELTRFGYAGAVPVRNRIARALLESPLARILNLWKYNCRLMAAEDMFFFKPAEEAKAALLAKRMARSEGLRGTEAQDRARQILGYGVEATRRARVQAESEGFTGSAAKRRTAEILNANRPEGLREEARQFALRTTFNNQPYGAMGAIAHVLNTAKQSSNRKVSVGANLVAPFLNIIANVVNESLNYTPIGATRALWPGDNLVGRPRAKLSLQEQADLKAELYSKAFAGTAMLAGLALAAARDLDDPDPEFAIYGQGPANDADRRGWLAKKALPHSIKFGNRYISYSNTPLAIPMAWLGNLFDRIRDARIYSNRGAQGLSENLPTMAATSAVGMAKVITEQSFLVGLMDVAETLSERQPEASGRGLLKYTARTASSFVVPNALRQIDKAFDPTIYEQRTAEGILVNAIPFVRGKFGRPTLNALGLPATNPVSSQFTSTQASVPPLVKMLAETGNWPSLPDRNHIYPNKGRTMTEDEFYDYVRGSGQTAFNWLEKQRTNGNLAKYDNATRAKVISGYFEAARKQWRGQHGW
jgi:hypothetical protein